MKKKVIDPSLLVNFSGWLFATGSDRIERFLGYASNLWNWPSKELQPYLKEIRTSREENAKLRNRSFFERLFNKDF